MSLTESFHRLLPASSVCHPGDVRGDVVRDDGDKLPPQMALTKPENPPRWWKRYVDDTYTVLRKDQAQSFTDYLNTVDEDIKWTTDGEVMEEVEVEGMENRMERGLVFLDTLSVINEDGTIKTRVYRKETHTDQYLNFQSNHPLELKRGVVKTLAYRVRTVVSEREDRRKELEHLRGVLKCNGYPDWIMRELRDDNSDEGEVKRPEPVKETSDKERNKKIPVVIPYIKGFSEQIRWVLGKYSIPTCFKPTNTLRQLLVKPKDPVDSLVTFIIVTMPFHNTEFIMEYNIMAQRHGLTRSL